MPVTNCYCGSGKVFATCCEPYLNSAEKAPTAEALIDLDTVPIVFKPQIIWWLPPTLLQGNSIKRRTSWHGLEATNG
ncbi:uncharacterized protein YchJ [Flavobacterium arsenatis]|uniref:Uncharacterized protein YchJ n=1 Tax=Flavobacterium arsenatis TaxID=1484332 RepID=A0ABU1TP90_9FLAO|nr:uncharacterized protein YchJ [Flavobacterium arsenatis]